MDDKATGDNDNANVWMWGSVECVVGVNTFPKDIIVG